MFAISLALSAAALMGSLFESTRWIGIACLAALAFLHPVVVLIALLIGAVAFVFVRFF